MRQAVIRKELTGTELAFEFDMAARYFFVKNFSDKDIYVSFEQKTKPENCFKIAPGIGEEVAISYSEQNVVFEYGDTVMMQTHDFRTKTIYVSGEGTGEVEVQGLDIYVKEPASSIEIEGNNLVVGSADTIDGNTLTLGTKSEVVEHSLVI